MEKYIWKQVNSLSSSSHKPSSRWGHSCCVVGEDIVFFGGYADSNYMNDLWAFNSITMKWREIETKGDLPAQRSNCSMNYDQQNNQIVIFGGGGSNKQRFNSISILNWETKQWIEVNPKQNQVAPWERTYHCAQLMFPYLIVFGGQGVADMDDLWVFNFKTLGWTQIKIPNDKVKPCARRFHSSVKIGNEFVILAGCHGKYRCLSDVFTMDMTPLIKSDNIDQLEWKEKKLKNSSFLTRWGHSSAVYDNKIYIFGGRFSNDLNDLLVADFETNTIKSLKIAQQPPAARRRHCAGFIGSSMLVFGGFNGQYFNDLHYISVHESRPKYEISSVSDEKQLFEYVNNKQHADLSILTSDNKQFYINVSMITKYFRQEQELNNFLQSLNEQYSTVELTDIFNLLYCGFGDYQLKQQLKSQLQYPIFQNKNEKLNYEKQSIQKSSLEEWERKIIKKSIQSISPIVKLNQENFEEYIVEINHKNSFDVQFSVSENAFQANKLKLMAKSPYFKSLLSSQFSDEKHLLIDMLGQDSKIVHQIFFNFLDTDFLVVPDNISYETYSQLTILAEYYCVPVLTQICCNELINMITNENVQKLLTHSIQMKIPNLSKACSDFWIKKTTQTFKLSEIKSQISKNFSQEKKVAILLQSMLERVYFDLSQVIMDNEKSSPCFKKKTVSSNSNMEKENYESNLYSQY